MTSHLPDPVDILGVRVRPVERHELVCQLVLWASEGRRRRAHYVNAHALNLAHEMPSFRDVLNRGDLLYCDGFGVQAAARLLDQRVPDRHTPPDWMDEFLSVLRPEHANLFLLGDEEGVLESFKREVQSRHGQIAIRGLHHGFFDMSASDNDRVVESIRESGATVLLVGMGMPRQEIWIDSNLHRLDIAIALPVGALFRYYTGIDRRASEWMRHHGLEWVGRLLRNPRRHAGRYLIGNPKFLIRVIRQRLTR